MNEAAEKRIFRIAPAFAGIGARAGFILLAAALLALSIALPSAAMRLILVRQERLEENRIEAALEALRTDTDEAEARRLVKAVLETKIERKFEGSGRAVLAPQYAEIAEVCLARGWNDEARAMAIKSIRHYHRVSRGLGYLDPWLVLEQALYGTDFVRFMPVFDYICSHSIESNRPFFDRLQSKRDPLASALYRYADMREKFHNLKPENPRLNLANYRIAGDDFEIRYRTERMRTLNALAKGNASDALQRASALAKQFPAELRAAALPARARQGTNAAAFADFFKNFSAKGVAVYDFSRATPVSSEYEPPAEIETTKDGAAEMRALGAVRLPFGSFVPLKAVHLAASGTDCLDVYPMLLVSIDGGEPAPIYVDSRTPELYSIPVKLAPGKHEITIEYLNDFARTIGGRGFDRNLTLHRLILERE